MICASNGRNPKQLSIQFGGVPIMNNLETRRYEMLKRVREFGTAHANLFPKASLALEMLKSIGATLDELSQHTASQASGVGAAREGSSTKAVARETLRENLDAISRTARVLALDLTGLDDKFRMPPGQSDQ